MTVALLRPPRRQDGTGIDQATTLIADRFGSTAERTPNPDTPVCWLSLLHDRPNPFERKVGAELLFELLVVDEDGLDEGGVAVDRLNTSPRWVRRRVRRYAALDPHARSNTLPHAAHGAAKGGRFDQTFANAVNTPFAGITTTPRQTACGSVRGNPGVGSRQGMAMEPCRLATTGSRFRRL